MSNAVDLWRYGGHPAFPAGQPTHNLLELVPPWLAAELQIAITRALASQRQVVINGLGNVRAGRRRCNVRLTPLQTVAGVESARLLVSFMRDPAAPTQAVETDVAQPLSQATAGEWSEAVRLSQEELEASREELQALNEELRNVAGRWYLLRVRPFSAGGERAAGVTVTFTDITDITDRRTAESELRRSEAFVAAQKEAFQAAMNGAPLETSLGCLVRAADYASCVDGLKIGPESPPCGWAMYTGQPVITPDVTREPRWKDWLAVAADFDFRGCWSFPIETSAAKVIGTLAIYHRQPRAATPRDLELATLLTRAAAIIISRHQEAEKRAQAEVALRKNGGELTRELEDTQARLHALMNRAQSLSAAVCSSSR